MATGAEIITKFINMVDDELDQDYMYQLMNDAKDEVESSQIWEILKDSLAITTASTSLPSDFNMDVVLSSVSDIYTKIKKEDQYVYNYGAYTYYLDIKNGTLEIIDYNSQPLYLFYTTFSDDITSTTSWGFPARFHSVLPYKMAQMYYASDAGEKSRAWDDRWEKYYTEKFNSMVTWDARLKTTSRAPRNYGESPLSLCDRS